MIRRFSRPARRGWMVVSSFFVAGFVGFQCSEAYAEEMPCSESPIQFAVSVKDVACNNRIREEGAADSSATPVRYHEFTRFAEVNATEVRARYYKAGWKTTLAWFDVKKSLHIDFPELKEKAREWRKIGKERIDGQTFDLASFRINHEEFCTGFVKWWDPSRYGYNQVLSGFFCQAGSRHTDEQVRRLLATIKVNEPS